MANRFPLIFNSGAGQIQELAASDNLDLTSSNLVNAGILFTSSGSQTAPSLQIGSGTTYNPGLYSPGTDQLAVATNGTGRLFIDASGNIGVGQTSPGAKLDVNGGALFAGDITNSAGKFYVVNTYGYFFGGSSNLTGWQGSNGTQIIQGFTGNTERLRIRADGMFEVKGAGTAGSSPAFSVNGSAPANSAIIDASGRLGIGNTSPNTALEVASTSTDIFRINKTGMTGIGLASSMAFQLTQTNAQSATLASITAEFMTNWSGNLIFSTKPSNGVPNNTVTEAARIDSSGRLLVGTSTARDNFFNAVSGNAWQFQVEGTNYKNSCASFTSNTTSTGDGPHLILARSRGPAIGSNAIVSSASGGDSLGLISFQGADGSKFVEGARISASVDGTPGSAVMPTRLVFATTADGAVSPTERMRIDSSGRLGIGTSSAQRLLDARGSVNLSTTAPTVSAIGYADIHLRTYSGAPNSPARITVVDSFMDFYTTFTDGFRWFNWSSDGVAAQRMTLDSSGRLGIGTTSVDAAAKAAISNGGAEGLEFRAGNTAGVCEILTYNRSVSAYTDFRYDAATHQWKIGGVDKAKLDSSGRLLVGTTTTATNSNTKLVIQQNNAPRSAGSPEAGLFLTTSSGGYALQAGAYDSGSLATSYTWISSVRSNDAYYDGSALPPLVFLIADQECMRITQQKELLIGTSTRNANGGVLQLKSGITFPANVVAATDVNTLDDYEEGTWAATITPQTSGTITLSANTGYYVKIGQQVVVTAKFTVSAVSTPLGFVRISLPFAAGLLGACSIITENTISNGCTNYWSIFSNGVIEVYVAGGINPLATSAAQFQAGSTVWLTATYFV